MSDPSGMHRQMRLQQNHPAHSFEYANAAAREGATGLVSTDITKVALQLDDHSLWLLVAVSPLSWVKVGGGLDAEIHSGGTNYNDLTTTGFYAVVGNASDTNSPFGPGVSCTLQVVRQDADNVTQLAISLSADSVLFRRRSGGSWAAWAPLGGAGSGLVKAYLEPGSYNWVVPEDGDYYILGCGGGGAVCAVTDKTGQQRFCGGGGGGAWGLAKVTLSKGQSKAVEIGAGGVVGSGFNGHSAGGNTSFGGTHTMGGGGKSTAQAIALSSNAVAAGGVGGVVTGSFLLSGPGESGGDSGVTLAGNVRTFFVGDCGRSPAPFAGTPMKTLYQALTTTGVGPNPSYIDARRYQNPGCGAGGNYTYSTYQASVPGMPGAPGFLMVFKV